MLLCALHSAYERHNYMSASENQRYSINAVGRVLAVDGQFENVHTHDLTHRTSNSEVKNK